MYGIDVILIEPGPVKSEIWSKAPDIDNNPFIGTDYEEHSIPRFLGKPMMH